MKSNSHRRWWVPGVGVQVHFLYALWFCVAICLVLLATYGSLAAAVFVSLAAVFVYSSPRFVVEKLQRMFPHVRFFLPRRNQPHRRRIALSIDDVPYEGQCTTISQILATLAKHKVYATLFVISRDAERSEDAKIVLKSAVLAGHALGNHGSTNTRHASLSDEHLYSEIVHCHQVISAVYKAAGKEMPPVMAYRPGCGWFSKRMCDVLERVSHDVGRPYILALGSVYPQDALVPFSWLNAWIVRWRITDSDIIVLHDREWSPKCVSLVCRTLVHDTEFCYIAETV